jgi:hypothetical protein
VKSSKFQAPSSREAPIVKLQSQEPSLGPTSSIPQNRTRAWKAARVAQALSLFEAWNFYGAWMLGFGAL